MLKSIRRNTAIALTAIMAVTMFIPIQKASALPNGFQDTTIISGLNLPTAVRFAPNGKVFVAEKSGLIKVFDSINDSTATIFADLRPEVQDFDDRGLNSIAVHPNFPTQPYVYAFYSMDAPIGQTPPVYNDNCPSEDDCTTGSRLTRMTASGDTMANKTVMLEGWCQQSSHHSAGDIVFGPDGALYVSHGDGGTANYADYGQIGNTCGDPVNEGGALHSQDLETSGDPVTYAGSILRIDPITGAALPDNPLIGGATDDDPIIAYGLRNPFRMTIDQNNGRIYAGNVGWNDWEEVEHIPSPTDSNIENFGWPCYEGVARQPAYDAANLPICENLYAANTAQRSYYEYFTPGGGAISGIALYRGNNFPAAYQGSLFFTDYTQSWIKVMMPDANGMPNPGNIVDFVPGGLALAVDLQIGPNGSLFYVDIFNGQVHMIRYASTNQPPVSDARADVTNGALPLTVNFNGSNSFDTDPGDTLQYAWDLDADGFYDDSTSITPQFTYTVAGNYTVGLRVTDTQGATNIDTITISAGNSAPQVSITSPTTGTTFAAGEQIAFSGTAVDPDSGALPASAYKWNFTLNHCAVGNPQDCHQHPIQEIVGVTSGTITAPDHEYPAFVTATLTATEPNSPNLSSSTSVNFHPRTTTITIDTVPSGLQATIYSQTATTPFTREVMVNATTAISANTPQTMGGNTYQFASWSDGGAQTHLINTGNSPQTITATFNQVITPVPSVWNSWDVNTQAGTPQARVTSNTGVTADIEFYESTNNFGVAKGSLLSTYIPGPHPDFSENYAENGWSADLSGYPYAGKSAINRGSDAGESNTPSPLGVRDLQLNAPNNDHTLVAAFKVPQNGTYTISNLGVRKVYNAFDGVRYRVFNAQGTQLAVIPTVTNQAWATSATTYTLPNLTVGQYIYFAIDRNAEVWYDSAEIAWTVSADLAPTAPARTPYDFDGDSKTDVGIFRSSDGSWWYSRSSDNGFRVYSFGTSTDIITPGDFTGDGKADIAIFRPSTGEWFIQRSEDNSFFSFPFGSADDVPAPADYDNDGKTDAAVFRPSNGTWFILNSNGSGNSIVQFGSSEDKPVPADFDGDGKADIAIFRPSDGSWWYLQSTDSQFKVYRFGVGTDKPVQGDYTGDGKADIAIFRPSTGEWYFQRSEDNSYFSVPFGAAGDIPAPGDYDGDGKFDTAIFRPSTSDWYVQRSTAGILIMSFGTNGDRPIPNAFVP